MSEPGGCSLLKVQVRLEVVELHLKPICSHSLQDWLQNQPVVSGEVEDVCEEAENTEVRVCGDEYAEVEDCEDSEGCAGNKLDREEMQSEVAKKALPEQEGGSSCFSLGTNQENDGTETLNSSIVLELNQDVADLPDLDEENAQESLSQKLKAIIHDLENISQQPPVAQSEHDATLGAGHDNNKTAAPRELRRVYCDGTCAGGADEAGHGGGAIATVLTHGGGW